jgi:enoyl-CoA hydratase/carnithine racemase
MTSFLKISRTGNIVTLTMDQPATRNALTGNTASEEFVQACADIITTFLKTMDCI